VRDFTDQIIELLGASVRTVPYSWDAVETAIGAMLPSDYKALLDRTGPIIIDDWLCLYGPDRHDRNLDIASLVEDREEAWVSFREAGVDLPERYFTAGSRLLAFAAVESNYFFWHAQPFTAPDDWSVVIVDADLEEWYEFDLSATECLYMILVGDIQLYPSEGLFEGPEHTTTPFP
jgi:hypothetical protein